MSLHHIQGDVLAPVPSIQFSQAGLKERGDLQRLLKNCFHIIDPKVLILAEEFSEWEDSRRRIDLLGIDRNGNLVIIELKRDEDGGHMELQALRYAAMVSTLTFDQLVPIYADYLVSIKSEGDARELLLQHLGYQDSLDVVVNSAVRIMLIAADFSREITTAVLWLNDQGLDITCTKFSGYSIDGKIFIDIDQVIPLPEAESYMVKVKEKNQVARIKESSSRNYDHFSITLGNDVKKNLPKGRSILAIVLYLAHNRVPCEDILAAIAQKRRFYKVLGSHFNKEDFLVAAEGSSQQNDDQVFDAKRWFTDDSELIHQGAATYAFSSQWGRHTETCMKRLITAFPHYSITLSKDNSH